MGHEVATCGADRLIGGCGITLSRPTLSTRRSPLVEEFGEGDRFGIESTSLLLNLTFKKWTKSGRESVMFSLTMQRAAAS